MFETINSSVTLATSSFLTMESLLSSHPIQVVQDIRAAVLNVCNAIAITILISRSRLAVFEQLEIQVPGTFIIVPLS